MENIMKVLDRFNIFMTQIAEMISNACVMIQIVVVFCGVVWRYCLHDPLSWVDELATLLMIVIAFLGCYVAMARHKLARIEVLLKCFHGRRRAIVYIISECIGIFMILFVIIYGMQLFLSPTSLKQQSVGMGIPMAIFYFLIAASFVLNLILAITDILHYVYDAPDQIDKEIDEREGFSV